MPWIDSLDWASLNALRRYPLREGTSALSNDESFSIPDTLITDFSLSATSDVTSRFYISTIVNNISSVTIEISDQTGSVVGTIEAADISQNDTDHYLNPSSLYAGANGKITIGSFKDLAYQPSGTFKFSFISTEFEPRTIVPGVKGIDRIIFYDTVNSYYSLTGNVKIAARTNTQFAYNGSRVFLDAGDELGLNAPCESQIAIKTINGVAPDPITGNINLIGLDCLGVTNDAENSLSLADTCCTPCSGCDDLELLTTKLIALENSILTMKDNYNNVSTQLSMYLATINSNCACPV
jgi:hypothetical protein